MADRMTKEQRHKCMSSIKGKDTKPEMLVRRYLHARGYRYRMNVKRLPGTPDIVLRRFRTVIFINGCFWHGHEGCRYFVMPKSNTPFWEKKIERNKQRDVEKRIQLRRMGWHTIIIWECELKPKNRFTTLQALENTLNKIFMKAMTSSVRHSVTRSTISMVSSTQTLLLACSPPTNWNLIKNF